MGVFRYRAVTAENEILEGRMEGTDSTAIAARISELGQIPLRIDEVGSAAGEPWWQRDVFAGRGLSRREVALLVRELATLVGAKVPLDQALDIQIRMARRGRLHTVLTQLRERVREGDSLAQAMADSVANFPDFVTSMIRAGESSGALEVVLLRLAEFLEQWQTLRERIRSALIYPTILVAMAGLSVFILVTVVIPEFRPIFEDAGAALPLITRIVLAASDVIAAYWWAMALAAVAAVVGIRLALRQADFRRTWDGLLLRLPLYGTFALNVRVAIFSRLLGTLLQNGVPLLRALDLTRRSLRNAVLIAAIDEVAGRAREGEGLARPLRETGLFPDLAVDLIQVGEETGEVERMLGRIADIYDQLVERSLTRLMAWFVPIVTIGLGVLIAGVIASILFAVLSVNQLAV